MDAAIEADYNGLSLPKPAEDGRINTLNNFGAMWPQINGELEKFLEVAIKPGAKILEIGAAYGVACMAALKRDATDYTAVDLDKRHLSILASEVKKQMPEKLSSLTLIAGAFPHADVVNRLRENYYDVIITENVLHFLTQAEMLEALSQFRRLLRPGGKMFVTTGSPYVYLLKSEVVNGMGAEVEEFLRQQKSNTAPADDSMLRIPGFFEYVGDLIDTEKFSRTEMDKIGIVPSCNITLLDREIAKYLLERKQFAVDTCAYMPMSSYPWQLDGREWLVIQAQKPE